MDSFECRLCGGDAGDTTVEDGIVFGGYGSTRYDMTKLVWTQEPPADLAKGDYLCDGCVDKLIEDGALEAFTSSIGRAGDTPSQAALKALFLLGARQMYETCAEERGGYPEDAMELDEEGLAAIMRLRATIHRDDSTASSHTFGEDFMRANRARDTGESHAIAAILLGYAAGPTPDFSEAAEDYATRVSETYENMRELFDLMDGPANETEGSAEPG